MTTDPNIFVLPEHIQMMVESESKRVKELLRITEESFNLSTAISLDQYAAAINGLKRKEAETDFDLRERIKSKRSERRVTRQMEGSGQITIEIKADSPDAKYLEGMLEDDDEYNT